MWEVAEVRPAKTVRTMIRRLDRQPPPVMGQRRRRLGGQHRKVDGRVLPGRQPISHPIATPDEPPVHYRHTTKCRRAPGRRRSTAERRGGRRAGVQEVGEEACRGAGSSGKSLQPGRKWGKELPAAQKVGERIFRWVPSLSSSCSSRKGQQVAERTLPLLPADRRAPTSPTSPTSHGPAHRQRPATRPLAATARQSVDQKVLGGLTVDFSTPVSGTPHLAKIFA